MRRSSRRDDQSCYKPLYGTVCGCRVICSVFNRSLPIRFLISAPRGADILLRKLESHRIGDLCFGAFENVGIDICRYAHVAVPEVFRYDFQSNSTVPLTSPQARHSFRLFGYYSRFSELNQAIRFPTEIRLDGFAICLSKTEFKKSCLLRSLKCSKQKA